jgi:hypothetical protein
LFLRVGATDGDSPKTGVAIEYAAEPPFALSWFDRGRGLFCWAPRDEELGREFVLHLRARKPNDPAAVTEQTLRVTLEDSPGRIERLVGTISYDVLHKGLNHTGYHATPSPQPAEAAFGGMLRELLVLCEPVQTIDYVRPKLALQSMSQFQPRDGVIDHPLAPPGAPVRCFQKDRIVAVYQGDNAEVVRLLTTVLGPAKAQQNVVERKNLVTRRGVAPRAKVATTE